MASMAMLALGYFTVGCGSHTSNASKASSPIPQIERNWTEFFSGSTPVSKKVQLLQNGQQFAPIIQAQARSPLASQTQATVIKVSLEGANRAKVVYTINVAGQPALKNQVGTAVLVGGVWRVSDQSFCALLSLEGTKPPLCPRP
jgi:hypothetical protein